MKRLRVGTRGSLLALRQCYGILAEIQVQHWSECHELLAVQVTPIRTEGDRAQGTDRAGKVTKKAWVEDIENALVSSEIDVAIHSGKDMPHELANGTSLLSVGQRTYPSDVFVGRVVNGRRLKLEELSAGMTVGTGSTRRKRFLRSAIPGVETVDHRGNVPTRIKNLDNNSLLDGIVLAEAGIRRLAFDIEYQVIPPEIVLPAQNQGILVAQYRADDLDTLSILNLVSSVKTQREFRAERAAAEILGADCSSCLGVFARHNGRNFSLSIRAASSVGSVVAVTESIELSESDQAADNALVDALVRRTIESADNDGIRAVMSS